MNLTEHFTWEEVTRSDTAKAKGIDNSLPDGLKVNVARVANLMEEIREFLGGHPLVINSWYRCPAVNKAVGSGPKSMHPLGLAVDFEAPVGYTNREVFTMLTESMILFDQVIHERTDSGANWIHVGLRPGKSRRQALIATGKVLGGAMSFQRVALG